MFAIDQTKTDQRPENLDGGIFLGVITGLRYYTPRLGRWASREPIGERGSAHRYTFAHNAAVGLIDLLGFYVVHGDFSHINTQIGQHAVKHAGHVAETTPKIGTPQIEWWWLGDDSFPSTACSCKEMHKVRCMGKVLFEATWTVDLPELAADVTLTADERVAWTAFIDVVTTHEKKHQKLIDDLSNQAKSFLGQAVGCTLANARSNCKASVEQDADSWTDDTLDKYQKAQDTVDEGVMPDADLYHYLPAGVEQ